MSLSLFSASTYALAVGLFGSIGWWGGYNLVCLLMNTVVPVIEDKDR